MHVHTCGIMTTAGDLSIVPANPPTRSLTRAIDLHLMQIHYIWIRTNCIRSGSTQCIRSGSAPATPYLDPHLLHQVDSSVPRLLSFPRLSIGLVAHGGRPAHTPAAASADAAGATSGATRGDRRSPTQNITTGITAQKCASWQKKESGIQVENANTTLTKAFGPADPDASTQ